MYRVRQRGSPGVRAVASDGGRGLQRGGQCSEFDRGRVIGLLEGGLSQAEVARIMGRTRSTVQRWWNRWIAEGNCIRRPGSARPRLTSEREDRHLRLLVVRNPWNSARMHHSMWQTNQAVSQRTARRRLLELNLPSCRPAHFIPLGPQHRQQRLQWCREHEEWNVDRWKSVVWSDESRFCLDFCDGRIRIRRFPNQRYNNDLFAYHDRYGGGSVMIWGGGHGMASIK